MQESNSVAGAPVAPSPPFVPTNHLRTWPAILTLFFLGGLLPETIATFNTPPISYIVNPVILLYLGAFYGSAALIAHDLLKRRNLRWAALLTLGAAYGIFNEGVVAGTWYHVANEGYQYFLGIDWAWAVGLTLFHMTVSTIAPFLVVEALFPRVADRPWLGKRGFRTFAVIFGLAASIGVLAKEAQGYRLLAALLAVVLIIVAVRLPAARPQRLIDQPVPRLRTLIFMGFLGNVAFFIFLYVIPARTHPPAIVTIALLVSFFALGLWRVRTWSVRFGWGRRQNVALIAGMVVLITLFSFIPPNPSYGEPVATVGFLFLSWFAIRRDIKLTKMSSIAEVKP